MKQFIFIIIIVCGALSGSVKAQVSYQYDEAGNRIYRHSTISMQSSRAKKAVVDSTVQKDNIGKQEILIYPNPTRGILKVEISGLDADTPVKLVLTDANGHQLIARTVVSSPETLDITTYPAGWYLMHIIRGTEVKEWKIIKE